MTEENCANCLYSTTLCRAPIYAVKCKRACCKAKSPKCWEPVQDNDHCDCWEPDTRGQAVKFEGGEGK